MKMEELKTKEVLSKDGTYVGSVDGVIINSSWDVKSLALKIDKDVSEDVGQPKPLLFSHKMDIGIEHIDKLGDKVLLKDMLSDLQHYLKAHNESYEAGRFRGMEVVDKEGRLLGKVEDILLECKETCSDWKIPSLLLKIDRDMMSILDLKKGFLSAPLISLSMEHVKYVGDVVMLDTSAKGLDDIIGESKVKKM